MLAICYRLDIHDQSRNGMLAKCTCYVCMITRNAMLAKLVCNVCMPTNHSSDQGNGYTMISALIKAMHIATISPLIMAMPSAMINALIMAMRSAIGKCTDHSHHIALVSALIKAP